jgi:hypothetical protein
MIYRCMIYRHNLLYTSFGMLKVKTNNSIRPFIPLCYLQWQPLSRSMTSSHCQLGQADVGVPRERCSYKSLHWYAGVTLASHPASCLKSQQFTMQSTMGAERTFMVAQSSTPFGKFGWAGDATTFIQSAVDCKPLPAGMAHVNCVLQRPKVCYFSLSDTSNWILAFVCLRSSCQGLLRI